MCERLSVMQDLAWACRILCSKFLECPHSSIWGMWCPEYPPPQWKFGLDLGLWVFSWQESPQEHGRSMGTNRIIPHGYRLAVKSVFHADSMFSLLVYYAFNLLYCVNMKKICSTILHLFIGVLYKNKIPKFNLRPWKNLTAEILKKIVTLQSSQLNSENQIYHGAPFCKLWGSPQESYVWVFPTNLYLLHTYVVRRKQVVLRLRRLYYNM